MALTASQVSMHDFPPFYLTQHGFCSFVFNPKEGKSSASANIITDENFIEKMIYIKIEKCN